MERTDMDKVVGKRGGMKWELGIGVYTALPCVK